MIPQLIIEPSILKREQYIESFLIKLNLSKSHPNLIWFDDDQKIGVAQTKLIREHLGLKPYQGISPAVVIISSENLSPEAQNSLLKTLEEPPFDAVILLGASAEDYLLPTVVSRCQIIYLQEVKEEKENVFIKELTNLRQLSQQERFQLIEKIEEKEEFFKALITYYHLQMKEDHTLVDFMQDLIEAQKWQKQNVNIRAILEYLMLKLPNDNKK